jgi:coenzyme F420-reducing hydrogenase alpha subunit
MIGGRAVHPNWGLPGGVSRGINEEQRKEIEALGRDAVEFAKFSLKVFEDVVLKNSEYVKLITGDAYVHKTYNMGTVDAVNCVNFYDGKIRVVGPDGRGTRQVRRQGLPRVRGRAGRALDVPEVPLPEEGRLEGLCRRRRTRASTRPRRCRV